MALQLLQNLSTLFTQREKINAAISTINSRVLSRSAITVGKIDDSIDETIMIAGVKKVLDFNLTEIYAKDFVGTITGFQYIGTETKWFAFDGVSSCNIDNASNVTITYIARVNEIEKNNTISIIKLANDSEYSTITSATMIQLSPGDVFDVIGITNKNCTLRNLATQLRMLEVV